MAEVGGIERVKKAGVLRVGSDITYPSFEFMDAGRILEEGTPEHFFRSPTHERTKQFLSKIL